MKFAAITKPAPRHCRAFTLAEVMAALVFMAIVIPVALEALSVASRAGEVAARKSEAVLVAERLLNESLVSSNWQSAVLNGTLRQGTRDFRWTLRSEPWNQDPYLADMRQLSVEVNYSAQGKNYAVQLSTLVENAVLYAQPTTTQ